MLAMPVATVALRRDSDHPEDPRGPLSSAGDDASYPVPSLPLHHARSCFRVYQRAGPPGQPSPPLSGAPPPTASDNEVSDLLRGCVDVDVQLDLLHRRCRELQAAAVSSDADRWRSDLVPALADQCVPLRDHIDAYYDEFVQSGDVSVHVQPSVMSAFYRPSLDFNKMQVSYCDCYLLNI